MDAMQWVRSEDWVGSDMEDKFVILNLESGEYLALNATAAAIWHALDMPSDTDALVDRLVARYNVERDLCAGSVATLLDELASKRLITRQKAG